MTHRTFDDPNSIEARQALLDRRCERKHPKRHRTRNRMARRKLAAKKRSAHVVATNNRMAAKFYDAVRLYWAGERDTHP